DAHVHDRRCEAGTALRTPMGSGARGAQSLRQALLQLCRGDWPEHVQCPAGLDAGGLPLSGLAARLGYARGMVRDAIPLAQCARALVVKLRHHGDVLLAAPVLSVLKAHAPRLEVDALVYDDTASMLEGHPALAQLHRIGRRWRSLGAFERLRLERALFS